MLGSGGGSCDKFEHDTEDLILIGLGSNFRQIVVDGGSSASRSGRLIRKELEGDARWMVDGVRRAILVSDRFQSWFGE